MNSPIAKSPRRPLGALLAATVTVTGKDGKTATHSFNRNKVPDDYPKDAPIYSPSKVVMSQSASEKNARSLVLESAGAAAAQLTILSATQGAETDHAADLR